MRNVSLKMPQLGLIAGTRVALGIGIGLLLSGKLHRKQRRKVGLTLLSIGGLSTIPLAVTVIRKAA
jgi:multisubunit Na+/H+ antiporter MnhB subunit